MVPTVSIVITIHEVIRYCSKIYLFLFYSTFYIEQTMYTLKCTYTEMSSSGKLTSLLLLKCLSICYQ